MVFSVNLQILNHLSPISPLVTRSLFSKSVCFCFTNKFIVSFLRFHIQVISYDVCLSPSDSPLLVWSPLGPSTLLQMLTATNCWFREPEWGLCCPAVFSTPKPSKVSSPPRCFAPLLGSLLSPPWSQPAARRDRERSSPCAIWGGHGSRSLSQGSFIYIDKSLRQLRRSTLGCFQQRLGQSWICLVTCGSGWSPRTPRRTGEEKWKSWPTSWAGGMLSALNSQIPQKASKVGLSLGLQGRRDFPGG